MIPAMIPAMIIAFIAQNMAPIMFASLVVFLLIGYPVAFSLAANGLFFFVIGVWLAPMSGGSIRDRMSGPHPTQESLLKDKRNQMQHEFDK